MSADNWASCPACWEKAKEQDPTLNEGDWEYDSEEATLREDYEIFSQLDGTVHVHYRGCCAKCGLETTFFHRHKFWDPTPEEPLEIPL